MEKNTKHPIANGFKEFTTEVIKEYTARCTLKDKLSSLIEKDYKNCIIRPPDIILSSIYDDYLKRRFAFFEQKAIKLISNDKFIEFIKSFSRIFWLAKIRFTSDIDRFDSYKSLEQYKHDRNLIVVRFQEYLYFLSVYHFIKKLEKAKDSIEEKIHKKLAFKSPDAIANLFNTYSKKHPGLLISNSFKKAIFLLLDEFDLDRYWFKSLITLMLTGKFFLPIPEDVLDVDINFDRNNNPFISIGLGRDITVEDLIKNWTTVNKILKDYYGKREGIKRRDIRKEIYIINRIKGGDDFVKAFQEVVKVLGVDEKEIKYENLYNNFIKRVYRTLKKIDPKRKPQKRKKLYGDEILSQIFDGDLEKFF